MAGSIGDAMAQAVAKKHMIDAAKSGKDITIDPKGSGMSGKKISALMKHAGRGPSKKC